MAIVIESDGTALATTVSLIQMLNCYPSCKDDVYSTHRGTCAVTTCRINCVPGTWPLGSLCTGCWSCPYLLQVSTCYRVNLPFPIGTLDHALPLAELQECQTVKLIHFMSMWGTSSWVWVPSWLRMMRILIFSSNHTNVQASKSKRDCTAKIIDRQQ